MNELQLHSRLSALADDLAPGDDPFELVAGARALHRRRRRTRIGVAGAALAVALVAVGVPTAMNTLSAPDRGDVAAPTSSLPTEGPPGAAEELRPLVDAVRAHLEFFEADGTLPDASDDLPCPGAMQWISAATQLTVHGQLGDTPPTVGGGCLWSTAPDPADPSVPVEERLDALLFATPGTTAETLLPQLTADVADGCRWTGELQIGSFAALQHCADAEKATWRLAVVDADGAGAWVLETKIGVRTAEQFGLAAGSIAGMLKGVDALEPVSAAPAISPMNQDLIEVVDALTARPAPVSLAATDDWGCRGGTAELNGALGVELTEGPVRLSLPPQPLCWWSAGPVPTSDVELARTLSLSIDFEAAADDAAHQDLVDTATQQVMSQDGPADAEVCLDSDPFTSPVRTTVLACSLDGTTEWTVVSGDRGDAGLWVLSARFPSGADVDPSTAVLALVELADRLW